MRRLSVYNPFNAPVYHEDTVDSTMEVSRVLARNGQPHGTVIAADFQKAGRGRLRERAWQMGRGGNLAFTVLLRFPGIEDIPPALTLRTGLAVSLAIEDFVPALAGCVLIKWPNDIFIQAATGGTEAAAGKAAGILAEADGGNVHIGIGVNVAQKQFPDTLRGKAASISLAAGREIVDEERYTLLEKILICLHAEIEISSRGRDGWRERIEARLYQKGRHVCFAEGPADSPKTVTGILFGIGPGGELLLMPDGGPETVSFTTGELRLM
jgi:BirA family biotin operon repressor/biotin-[acetyl-CoA-carboxylase] ligase